MIPLRSGAVDDLASPLFSGGYWVQGSPFWDGRPVVQCGGWLDFAGQEAGVKNGDVLYTSPADITDFSGAVIECVAGTAEVQVSIDGTNWVAATAAVLLHDATAVTTFIATIAAGKVGQLKGRYRRIRVRQNGASATTIRGAHVCF